VVAFAAAGRATRGLRVSEVFAAIQDVSHDYHAFLLYEYQYRSCYMERAGMPLLELYMITLKYIVL
jgi:hypothetical protein